MNHFQLIDVHDHYNVNDLHIANKSYDFVLYLVHNDVHEYIKHGL